MTNRPPLYDAAVPARREMDTCLVIDWNRVGFRGTADAWMPPPTVRERYTLHPAANWPRRVFLALLVAALAVLFVVGAGGCGHSRLQLADEYGQTLNRGIATLNQQRRERKISDSQWPLVYSGMVLTSDLMTKVEDAALAGGAFEWNGLVNEFLDALEKYILRPKAVFARQQPATRPAAAPTARGGP